MSKANYLLWLSVFSAPNSVANKGQYKKAIGDFMKALTINNSHSNAKKYLAETQEAYGKQLVTDTELYSCQHSYFRLEEAGNIQSAMHCYREALADDPSLESPKRRLHYLEAQVFCTSHVVYIAGQ